LWVGAQILSPPNSPQKKQYNAQKVTYHHQTNLLIDVRLKINLLILQKKNPLVTFWEIFLVLASAMVNVLKNHHGGFEIDGCDVCSDHSCHVFENLIDFSSLDVKLVHFGV
jgi:hypothetical protein